MIATVKLFRNVQLFSKTNIQTNNYHLNETNFYEHFLGLHKVQQHLIYYPLSMLLIISKVKLDAVCSGSSFGRGDHLL